MSIPIRVKLQSISENPKPGYDLMVVTFQVSADWFDAEMPITLHVENMKDEAEWVPVARAKLHDIATALAEATKLWARPPA